MTPLDELLTLGWPQAQWSLRDQDYATLDWHPANPEPKPTLKEILAIQPGYNAAQSRKAAFHLALSSGHPVTPEGFTLSLDDPDRAAFTQMLALVKEALDLGLITHETPQLIADRTGTRHEVTTLRFRQIMVAYGLHYKTLWDALTAPAPPP